MRTICIIFFFSEQGKRLICIPSFIWKWFVFAGGRGLPLWLR